MNILISNDSPYAHYYIRLGIARVFSAMGHNVIIWDITKKSAFDAFDEVNPDIFIGQTYNLNQSLIKVLAERPMTRVILKASDWGDIYDEIDRNEYPVLIASEQEKENVFQLRDKTGKPDFVFVHYMEDRLNHTHNHWIENDIQVESLMNAADIFDYTNGQFRPEYECDIAFVGGRWGYKSKTFDKWFLPLLNPKYDYNIKIFGNQSWGVPQFCGFIPNEEVKHLFASAKICINLSEPHSRDFGYDVIERPFKLWSNKSFCISDFVEDLHEIYPNGRYAKTAHQFFEIVDHWIDNNEDDNNTREEIIEENYRLTMNNHTYFNRVAHILDKLGMSSESTKCRNIYKQICDKLGI